MKYWLVLEQNMNLAKKISKLPKTAKLLKNQLKIHWWFEEQIWKDGFYG